ncbi:MAG: PAS domain S-box protein [Flavobacteriales bacterium]|nr:PAS domain S-box protein [Flavobacteriales bacterium]
MESRLWTDTRPAYRRPIVALYMLLFALLLWAVASVTVNSSVLIGRYDTISRVSTRKLSLLNGLHRSAAYIQVATLRHLMAEDSLAKVRERIIIDTEFAKNSETIAEIGKLISDSAERVHFHTILVSRAANTAARDSLLAISRNDGPKAMFYHNTVQYALFESWQNAVAELDHHIESEAALQMDEAQMVAARTVRRITVMLALFAILLVMSGILIRLSVRRMSLLNNRNANYIRAIDQTLLVNTTDAKGYIVHANDHFLEMTGYSLSELMGQNPRMFNSGLHSEEFFRGLWQQVLAGNIWKGLMRNRMKDGSFRWLDTTIVPFMDEDGQPEEFVVLRHDITARIEAREALAKEREHFRILLLSIGDAVIATDLEGRVTMVNPVAEALIGWKEEDAVGRPLTEVYDTVHQVTREKLPSSVDVVLSTARVVHLSNNTTLIAKDGSEYIISSNGAPIIDNEGKLQGAILVFRDETEKHFAQQQLEESEKQYRGIIEGSGEMICRIAATGHFLLTNPAFRAQFGYAPDELECMTFWDIVAEESQPACTVKFAKVLAGESLGSNDAVLITKQGDRVEVSSNASPMTEHGTTVGAMLFMRNVTLRRQAERAILNAKQGLEDAVEQRTMELNSINGKLEQEMALRTETMEKLGRLHTGVIDSINYAKRIQNAMLPSLTKFRAVCPDSFVLHRPQAIVSGDFLWWKRSGPMLVAAAVDCTGHGVPGALMSVIATDLLDRVVQEHINARPDEILSMLDRELIDMLSVNRKSDWIGDGMDVALCMIDHASNTILFSGAYRPLLVADGRGAIVEYRGSTSSIGGATSGYAKNFTSVTVPITEGMVVYMGSDGYQSQFGGPHDRKFGKARLRDLLCQVSILPMPEQRHVIENTLLAWQGDKDLTDDIMLIGIRF